MAIDMTSRSGLAIPKPEPRKKQKGREDRLEAKVIKEQRAETVDRDDYCRLHYHDAEMRAKVVAMFGSCKGPSEWSHYNRTHRRSKTVGQPPEERHQRKHSLMLCDYHANQYDENRMDIEELTPDGCDGPLRFSQAGAIWEEQ